MKTLTVADGGHVFSVQVREDVDLAVAKVAKQLPHLQFLAFWAGECEKMGVPFHRTAIELKVAKQLLKKYTLKELKTQARACRLDHGEEFRTTDYESSLIFLSIKLKHGGGDLTEGES